MDARVERTKNSFRTALLDLLQEEPFSKLTVTDLCRKAGMSRYSFYAHYDDKHDLLEDTAQHMDDRLVEAFRALQRENNPSDDARQGYRNLLDALLRVMESDVTFFDLLRRDDSFDLMMSLFRILMRNIDRIEVDYADRLSPRYDRRQLNSFLVAGFCAFVSSSHVAGKSAGEIRDVAQSLLDDLLESGLFEDE